MPLQGIECDRNGFDRFRVPCPCKPRRCIRGQALDDETVSDETELEPPESCGTGVRSFAFAHCIGQRELPQGVARVARFDIQHSEPDGLRLPGSTRHDAAGDLDFLAHHCSRPRMRVVDDVSPSRCDAHRARLVPRHSAQRQSLQDQRARFARKPHVQDARPVDRERAGRRNRCRVERHVAQPQNGVAIPVLDRVRHGASEPKLAVPVPFDPFYRDASGGSGAPRIGESAPVDTFRRTRRRGHDVRAGIEDHATELDLIDVDRSIGGQLHGERPGFQPIDLESNVIGNRQRPLGDDVRSLRIDRLECTSLADEANQRNVALHRQAGLGRL